MQDHPVLGQVALGYSPIIDRQRNVVATRLTVFAEPGSTPPDALALLYLLGRSRPAVANWRSRCARRMALQRAVKLRHPRSRRRRCR